MRAASPLRSSPLASVPPRVLSPPRVLRGESPPPPGLLLYSEVAERTTCFSWPRVALLLFCLELCSLVLTTQVPFLPWLSYASQNSPMRFTWQWQGCYDYPTGINDGTVRGCDPPLPAQLLYGAVALDALSLVGALALVGAACAEARRRRGGGAAAARRALAALRVKGPLLARLAGVLRVIHLALLIGALVERDRATPLNAWTTRLGGFSCLAAAIGCSAATLVGWVVLSTAEMWRTTTFVDIIGAEAARVRGVLSSARETPSPERAVGGYAVGGAASRLFHEKALPATLRG